MYTLDIQGRLPGLNDVISANRASQYKGARMKHETQEAIQWAIVQQLGGIKLDKVRLSFFWHEPNMKRDPDNISSAIKFVLDALVAQGILPNDGWDNIKPPITHDWDNNGVGVTVTIEEVNFKEVHNG